MLSSDPNRVADEEVERVARQGLQGAYEEVRGVIAREADISHLPDADLQRLLAVSCKEFALRQEGDARFPPFAPEHIETLMTATDAAVVSSAVLDALSVEIFELGLWKTWGTT